MRLVSFTVLKYRSIKTAHKVKVGSRTILVGPNNEGKSNLIRALVTAMSVLTTVREHATAFIQERGRVRVPLMFQRSGYDWERDYPIELQDDLSGESEITLEFQLSNEEIEEFKSEIKSSLNGTLPLKISLGARGWVSIRVAKKGIGGKKLTAKSARIAKFVSRRVNFEHIPAVRTASAAQRIVAEMVERELAVLEAEPRYNEALRAIEDLQQPVLNRLSISIKQTLGQFLPDVSDVKVQIPSEVAS
jgi:hypothetical protein